MALQMLFQILWVVASFEALTLAYAATQPYPIAKPNCIDACGTVHLPFPFGVGRGCFLDEWCEIICVQLNDTVSQPRLKKLNLEVLSISLPRKSPYYSFDYTPPRPQSFFDVNVTVSFPITYSNSSCANNATRDPVTFQHSPFVFSETNNIFLTSGCDATARLQFFDDTTFIGCMTNCTGSNTMKNSSSGSWFDYCISTVLTPPSPQGYIIKFDQGRGIHEHCGFASLVQKSWFKSNPTDLYKVMNHGYVPVILEWGILNTTLRDELVSAWDYSSPYICKTTNYINHNTTPLMQCGCYDGYGGNAYLINWCQDINECETGDNNCQLGKCRNLNGGYTCNRGYSKMQHLTTIGIYVGIGAAPAILTVLSIWLLYKWIKRRNQITIKKILFKECVSRGILLQQQFSGDRNVQHGKLFSSKELRKATDKYNKNRILGQGGQGTVYKGTLKDTVTVAVKKSKEMDDAYVKQFINEVVILSQINHRNIVKLLGVCLETAVPLLVYEFIPNGTLHHYLHHQNDEYPLTWDARLGIAIEVAGALSYMHSASSVPVYHRDIKSRNILMDRAYRAKVADFGISRTVSLDQTHVTTMVQGTFGYLDPEYYRSSQYTDKSDVYSFGVVLVELLTGQEPISSLREGEDINLAAYFLHSLRENRLFDILDKEVATQGVRAEIEIVANLTKRCLHVHGRNRPTMREVATKLESIRGFPQNGDGHLGGGSRQRSFAEDCSLFEVTSDIDSTSDVQPLAHFHTW